MLGRALLPSSVRSFCLQIQEAVLNVPTAQSTRRVKERVGGVYPRIFKLIFTGRGWGKGGGGGETLVCWSTYLCIHSLLLGCALTRNQARNIQTQPFLRANPSSCTEHFVAQVTGAPSQGHSRQQGRLGTVDFSALCPVKLRSVLVL